MTMAEASSPGGMISPTGEHVDVFPDGGQAYGDEGQDMGHVDIPKELDGFEAAAASTILGKLFEKLSLLSLLKVDASVQVRRGNMIRHLVGTGGALRARSAHAHTAQALSFLFITCGLPQFFFRIWHSHSSRRRSRWLQGLGRRGKKTKWRDVCINQSASFLLSLPLGSNVPSPFSSLMTLAAFARAPTNTFGYTYATTQKKNNGTTCILCLTCKHCDD